MALMDFELPAGRGETVREPTGWFGALPLAEGGVRFRLFAPDQAEIELVLEGGPALPMRADGAGWHELVTDEARIGCRYRFRLGDGTLVPDPASRFQPEDCHGPSEVVDPAAHAWQDGEWTGRPLHEAVIYELHVGAFTRDGTFRAAIERLDHLVELGVTAIELMPVADFPGRWNWGYDGVLLYAPDSSYGRPEDLKALVDAAHARGLMVVLDVIYNHFGPDGNYLGLYAKDFFTERHHTPWGGAAINFDGEQSRPVREFIIQNAIYWVSEFHLDGLRLDAVHAIIDDSAEHLLNELARRVRAAVPRRQVHLMVENEHNDPDLLDRDDEGRPRAFSAQWNDDVHHVLHTATTGEGDAYYAPYLGDTEKLGRALADGFAFQGEVMGYRGSERGKPSGHLPPQAFVAFLQNHDQIGNRAFGDRITDVAPFPAVRAAAAVYLLAPQIPMLFMGEEYATTHPFPFFCDCREDLRDAVRDGRREEFRHFPAFHDQSARLLIPDPTAAETFRSAKLDWAMLDDPYHADWLDWYRRILAVRRAQVTPRLLGMRGDAGRYAVLAPSAVEVDWQLADGARLLLVANLSEHNLAPVPQAAGQVIWSEGRLDDAGVAPWSIRFSLDPAG